MKKLFTCMVALFLATTALWAYDFKEGDLCYNIISDSTVEVAYSWGGYSMSSIDIPEYVRDYHVIGIASSAFMGSSNVKDITFPNSIKYIRDYALDGSGWYEKQPRQEVIYAGHVLYKYKTGYNPPMPENTKIVIKEGTTIIADNAFYNCKNLISITIPNSVTSIGDRAFDYCTGLTSITIPNSVTSIGYRAFGGCTGLTSIVIPNSVKYLSGFSDCTGLTSITIPNSVTCIGKAAFDGCNFTSITIPNSVTSIERQAFRDCTGLTSITIPYSVTSIGDEAFRGCTGLTSITIPYSVTSIGDETFRGCTGLTSITIPNSVTSIGENAFYWVFNVTYNGTAKGTPWGAKSVNGYVDGFFVYENAKKERLLACSTAATGEVIIPNSVTSIGNRAFGYCADIISITIPDSVKWIGNYAFHYCRGLTSVTIPNSVTSLGDWAFYYCRNLSSIVISDSVTSMGEGVFAACGTLRFVKLPEKLSSIPMNAFNGCDFMSVTIPESVTYIGDWAFESTKNLKEVRFLSNMPPSCGEERVFGDNSAIRVLVPAQSIEAYKASNLNYYHLVIHGFSIMDEETTQTTIQLDATLAHEDSIKVTKMGYFINDGDSVWLENTDTFHIEQRNLSCDTEYKVSLFAVLQDSSIIQYSTMLKTLPAKLSLNVVDVQQISASLSAFCDLGDIPFKQYGIQIAKGKDSNQYKQIALNSNNKADTTIQLKGLTPNMDYTIRGFVVSDTKVFNATCLTEDFEGDKLDGWKTGDYKHTNYWGREKTGGNYDKDKYQCVFSPSKTVSDSYLYHDFTIEAGKEYIVRVKISCKQDSSANCKAGIGISYGYSTPSTYESIDNTIISIRPTTIETEYIGVFRLNYTYKWSRICLFAKSQVDIVFDDVYIEERTSSVYTTPITFTTKPVVVDTPTITDYGQTYMLLATSSNYGDATLVEEAVEYGTSQSETQTASVSNNMVKINNLFPDTRYYYRSLLTTTEGGTIYSDWQEMTTKAITLTTGEADGISAKSVFLHGTIDCDMESRTEIGFEWKRSDAPATLKPQRVLVTDRADSTLVFRLEGLDKDKYYDFRSFCLYKEQTYYGKADDGREWVTFLTALEDVLVAPSVQTLGAETSEAGVVLSGFVVAGTENIIQKGFESWRKGTTDVATTVSEGAVMTNEIPEPWSYTTYQYRAYAKTPSGTTYGETKEVTTGYIHKEITDVVVTPSATTATVTWTIVEQADYYILTLFGNAEMTDTLATYTVDEAGNITQRRAPAALRALVNCSIDQLTPDTDYFFTVIAYNSDEKKVAEENGSFTTQLTTGIDNISDNEGDSDSKTDTGNTNRSSDLVRKVFRNGQVYILRGDKTYTLTGVEVK